MEIYFNEKYLRDLYTTGKAGKKQRFQPQTIKKYIRIIDLIRMENNVLGLTKYNSLKYVKLTGDKIGLSSVRVNDQYRIEFEEKTENDNTVATICNIIELSNLYK